MIRGQQVLFNNILPQTVQLKNPGIGRSKHHINKRNEKLIHRYYWYAALQPKRLAYDYIIGELEKEFDISAFRLIIVLQENHSSLKKILTEKPDVKELQKKYPYLCWS